MLNDISDLQFEAPEAVALRLAQIALLAMDIKATEPELRPHKEEAFHSFTRDVVKWAELTGCAQEFVGLSSDSCARTLKNVIRRLQHLDLRRTDMAELMTLEILTLTALPKGSKWSIKLDGPASNLVQQAFSDVTLHIDVARLRKRYHRALRALSREATSPALRLGLVGGTLALAAVSSGIVAAIGAAIGSTMGLSGAAATSAGLAWLGGGSSAMGGFGVAGGAFIVTEAAKGTYAGVRRVATIIAAHYSRILVGEISKLCVACELHPALAPSALAALRDLADDVQAELRSNPTKELHRSQRAIAAAIRRIEDGDQRAYQLARMVTRIAPVPGANDLVDSVRRRQRDRS